MSVIPLVNRVMDTIWMLSVCVLIFSSCSFEKRIYNRGFYVEWHKATINKTKSTPKERSRPTDPDIKQLEVDEQVHEKSTETAHQSFSSVDSLQQLPELENSAVHQEPKAAEKNTKQMGCERSIKKRKNHLRRQNTSTSNKVIGGVFILLAILCVIVCVLLLHAPTASFLAFIGGLFLFIIALISAVIFVILGIQFLFSNSPKTKSKTKTA